METFESDTTKSEHLKKGERPIIACIGTPRQFMEKPGMEQEVFMDVDSNLNISRNSNVDYYGDPRSLKKRNFKNAGNGSYVISSIDSSNKFSQSFNNCTGLVVTGKDKETGENISFLSHQYPRYFLNKENKDNENIFTNDLSERLRELKEKSVDGSIDAVIVGGNYLNKVFFRKEGTLDDTTFRQNYLDSIALLSKEVSGVLGFAPVVITGPKVVSGADDVFYDNEHRRLYIMRPEVGKDSTKSYLPRDLKKQKKKW